MKNFILEKIYGRRSSWILLSLNDNEVNSPEYHPFTKYCEWLEHTKNYSNSTIEQYVGHVARFIDFMFEVSKLGFELEDVGELFYLYKEYLLHALDSDDHRVVKLCESLGKKRKTSINSISQGIESSLSSFMLFNVSSSESYDNDLFSSFFIERSRSKSELSSIKNNSWLSGSIKKSLRKSLKSVNGFKVFSISKRARSADKKKFDNNEDYPLEHVEELLSLRPKRKTKCFNRDMALYSLLSAIGCRTHEALQIRIDDIDFEKKTIRLVNPYSRDNEGLTPSEIKKLKWKGRDTELSLPIYPFDAYFWEHLEKYLKYSYQTNVNHKFLFQKSNGRPLFVISRSDRNKTFRKYAKESGLNDISLGLHSLRHMYGRYLLNYYPNGNGGYGMPIEYVQILMGHSNIKSTKKYAVHDMDIYKYYIETANRINRDDNINIKNLKERYVENQIKLLKEQVG